MQPLTTIQFAGWMHQMWTLDSRTADTHANNHSTPAHTNNCGTHQQSAQTTTTAQANNHSKKSHFLKMWEGDQARGRSRMVCLELLEKISVINVAVQEATSGPSAIA